MLTDLASKLYYHGYFLKTMNRKESEPLSAEEYARTVEFRDGISTIPIANPRVLNWNLYEGRHMDLVRKELSTLLSTSDIFIAQEAPTPFSDSYEHLLDGFHIAYIRTNHMKGNMIASRAPFTQARVVHHSHTEPRCDGDATPCRSTLTVRMKDVDLSNVQLPIFCHPVMRLHAIKQLLYEHPRGKHVIAGDFNFAFDYISKYIPGFPREQAPALLMQKGYHEGAVGTKMLDRVYSRDVSVIGPQLLDGHDSSDHDPLRCTLRF